VTRASAKGKGHAEPRPPRRIGEASTPTEAQGRAHVAAGNLDRVGLARLRDIPVIPILLDGARVPNAGQLPKDLEELALRNALDVRHASFHNDLDRLVRALKLKANAEKSWAELQQEEARRAGQDAGNERRLDAAEAEKRNEVTSSPTRDDPYSVQDTIKILFAHVFNIAIHLRRVLLPNALFIVPWLLFAAVITVFLNPDSESLHISLNGTTLSQSFESRYFGATIFCLSVFGGLFWVTYGLWRSFEVSGPAAEMDPRWMRAGAVVFSVVLVVAFCQLQPLILDGMFKSANRQGGILAYVADWLESLVLLLAPFSALVFFFRPQINSVLKEGDQKRSFGDLALRAAGKAAVYVAGAATPFLVWMAYLYLAFAAIKDLDTNYVNLSGSYYHAPLWLSDISQHWFGYNTPIAWFYFVAAMELFALFAGLRFLARRRRQRTA
jgi:hypothetical protein